MAEFINRSEVAKAELRCSERQLCRSLALPRSTYRRWRARLHAAADIIRAPGPQKCEPLPLAALKTEIARLCHGRKRTSGTGLLYRRCARGVSRRAFQSMVTEARAQQHQHQRQTLQHIHWNHPNLAWATDASEYQRDQQGLKLRLVAAQDLRSSFRFAPLCALALSGQSIAAYLEQLFSQHGPPLLLKRDNGSLFNNAHVDRVLAHWQVLPLNSPPYYARFNGGIEKGIRELKTDLPAYLSAPAAWDLEQVRPTFAALCLQQNAQPRRKLHGQSACESFYDAPRHFGRRDRCAAFESIRTDATARLKEMENPNRRDFDAAWRQATVHWLVCQNLITISKNETSVTPFSKNVVS